MASSSSSSSSALSPNAPPFVPPQASLFISQQPTSSQPTTKALSAKAAPFTKTLCPNSNLDNNDPIVASYYPYYDSGSDGFDGFSSSYLGDADVDDLSGMGLGPWNAAFDEVEENGMQLKWAIPSQGVRPKVKITAPNTSRQSKVIVCSKKPEPSSSTFISMTCTTCKEKTCDNHCPAGKTSLPNSLPDKLVSSQKNVHECRIKESDVTAKKVGTDTSSSLTKPLKLLRVNNSKVVNEKSDSLDTSTETCNENDFDLDSPCWKGIQAYKQSAFQMDVPKTMNHPEKSEHLNLDVVKKDSGFVSNINDISSNFENKGKDNEQATVVVQDQCRISDENKGQDKEQATVVVQDQCRISDENRGKDKEQATVVVQDQCRISNEKGQVSQKINVEHSSAKTQNGFPCVKSYEQLIDNTLLCLRKSLMSRTYKDELELNELLHNILFLADHYPEANILDDKKDIAKESDDDYKRKSSITRVQDSVEKDKNTFPSRHMISTHNMGIPGAKQPTGHYTTHLQDIAEGSHYNLVLGVDQPHMLGIKYDAISKNNIPTSYKPDDFSLDVDIVKGIAHDFEAVLKKSFCEQEQNLQTLVHKNLWIEAQAKLFSLKYELQLACAEIEILKRNQYPRGRFQEVGMLPGLKSLGSPQASNPFIDAGSSSARDFHPRNAGENYISFQRLLA